MVTDISEARLVILFIEGLSKPLCGWVKGFEPTTLLCRQLTRLGICKMPPLKTNSLLSPLSLIRVKSSNPSRRSGPKKPKMDEETWKELRKKKLCFSCQVPWASRHKCVGKDKLGKAHYICGVL